MQNFKVNLRNVKDICFKNLVYIVSLAIIIVVLFMFAFLLNQTFPLFKTGSVNKISTSVNEQKTISPFSFISRHGYLLRLDKVGNLSVFESASNTKISSLQLGTTVDNIQADTNNNFITVSNNKITLWHFNDETLELTKESNVDIGKFDKVFFNKTESVFQLITKKDDNFVLTVISQEYNSFTDENITEQTQINFSQKNVKNVLFSNTSPDIYLITDDSLIIASFDSSTTANFHKFFLTDSIQLSDNFSFNNSLLVLDKDNQVHQFFIKKNDATTAVSLIRTFKIPTTNKLIAMNAGLKLKNFLILDEKNNLFYINTTSEKYSIDKLNLGDFTTNSIFFSEQSQLLLLNTDSSINLYSIDTPHSDISFKSLFAKVFYEGYDAPQYIWQSTGGDGYESKFSLIPLIFGTIKATLYSLIIAIPFAILAAIYVGYFMQHGLRNKIKPIIEMLAAIPTVVIGLLASIMLAPVIESSLLFILLFATLIPIFAIVFGFAYDTIVSKYFANNSFLNKDLQFISLIIFIILFFFIIRNISSFLEYYFFDNSFFNYFFVKYNIDYNQKNTFIVGIAMGIAIIPTIFTMTEDSLYNVPNNLILGSYALGANKITTFFQIILPMITPAIFAGIIMGIGRAVGETMIVLMVSGNTALMNWDIFSGLRALSANIAIEMPEAEVDSTHYRILFLSGLVLFIFTFIINLIAEIIRQNLKKKYSLL